ncbi:MAG TPA: hypothetical protein VNN21_10295, partial [Dehalococcoidia bacterium]|nr:hypothetical protein [Dehalococcoidia bacterium]
HLDLYQSNNLHTIVSNGCVGTFKDNGGNCAIQEDSVVEGQFDVCLLPGNRASAARQGVSDYYTYEGTGGFPAHATCNIYYDATEFTVDPLGPAEPLDANGDPLSTQAIEAKIDACDEDPDPTDRVSGRLWPIAILNQLPENGNQPQTITHVALMYQVCDHYDNKFDCSIGGNGGNDAIYGMFVESRPVNFKVSGVGTMPGGAVHVVLVK